MDQINNEHAELVVSDPSQLGPLQKLLSLAVPEASVSRIAGKPGAGEQGALDVLVVVASSGGLVTAIKVLPEFLRSRRTGLSITTNVKGKQFELTATNVDDVMPILEKILDA